VPLWRALRGLRQHIAVNLAEKVREVPDWPQKGVGFKDVTPLLADPEALRYTIEQLAEWGAEKKPDLVLGAEAAASSSAPRSRRDRLRVRSSASPRQAAAGDDQRELRARVRTELARAPSGDDPEGFARAHPR
jgi:hypothetical protein